MGCTSSKGVEGTRKRKKWSKKSKDTSVFDATDKNQEKPVSDLKNATPTMDTPKTSDELGKGLDEAKTGTHSEATAAPTPVVNPNQDVKATESPATQAFLSSENHADEYKHTSSDSVGNITPCTKLDERLNAYNELLNTTIENCKSGFQRQPDNAKLFSNLSQQETIPVRKYTASKSEKIAPCSAPVGISWMQATDRSVLNSYRVLPHVKESAEEKAHGQETHCEDPQFDNESAGQITTSLVKPDTNTSTTMIENNDCSEPLSWLQTYAGTSTASSSPPPTNDSVLSISSIQRYFNSVFNYTNSASNTITNNVDPINYHHHNNKNRQTPQSSVTSSASLSHHHHPTIMTISSQIVEKVTAPSPSSPLEEEEDLDSNPLTCPSSLTTNNPTPPSHRSDVKMLEEEGNTSRFPPLLPFTTPQFFKLFSACGKINVENHRK